MRSRNHVRTGRKRRIVILEKACRGQAFCYGVKASDGPTPSIKIHTPLYYPSIYIHIIKIT